MKIGLIDVDGHHWPNLALMKLSAYHKQQGDSVEWWNGFEHYDVVYKSRVFDDIYTQDEITCVNAECVICGGTGYDLKNKLSDKIEHQCPDYSLYPNYKEAYGHLTRGCPRACPFCVVSDKEGRHAYRVADLSDFWRGQKEIKLIDPNLLACKEHEQLLQQLAKSRAWVDFTQGIDIRLVTTDNLRLLNNVRTKAIHFAWDNPRDDLTGKFEWYIRKNTLNKRNKPGVYVLTNYWSTLDEDLNRIYILRDLGYNPYVMVYDKPNAPREIRMLQRWVNNKIIFNKVKRFEQYNQR